MPLPTIEELKKQCYIDGDYDNELLLQFLTAAVSEVERVTNRKLQPDKPESGDPEVLFLTPDIEVRLRQMVGFWYENREGQSLPDSLYRHLRDYRRRP